MADERRERAWAVFDQLADVPADQRQTALRAACGDDLALRAEVERLLALDDRLAPAEAQAGFLQSPLLRTPCPTPPAPGAALPPQGKLLLPDHIGRYRVLGLLGEGGMGAVYEAEQDSPHRPVALKVIRPGLLAPALLKRFAQEVEILGRLHHPGIAQIYEAGVAEDGQPFFAMEFIRGLPLDEYGRLRSPTLRERVELLARVCDAVQHAHDQGVIHRDLKPANILVEERGQPKVLDFGVARATDADLVTGAGLTRTGQLLGTANYMSPEQVTADPAAIDHRADVYALGVILFELLAHRPPYQLEGRPLAEAARLLLEEEPPRLGSVDTELRGDIETIVAKALEKDRTRRYASAAELGADIRRHLRHEPIRARPVGSVARLARWCRRRPATAALLAALAVVVLTSLALVTWKWLEADQQRRDAQQTAEREIRARQLADEYRQEARHRLYVANVRLAQQAWNGGQVEHMLALLDEAARRRLGDEDLRGFEWYYLQRLGHPKVQVLKAGPGEGVAFSPNGRRLASAEWDGTIRVWEAATGKELFAFQGHDRGVLALAFSPDGRFLASGGTDRTVRLWEADTGRKVRALRGHTNEVRGVAFSPDGRRLASASSDNEVRLWETHTGRKLLPIRPYEGPVMGVAFSPDGRRLALAYGNQRVGVCDAATGKELLVITGRTGWITGVAFSPDGGHLAAGSDDRLVHVWEARTGKEVFTLRGHADWVTCVAFSRDGRRLASASRDGTARVWDAATGRELLALKGHSNWVMGVAFSRDGGLLATASYDGTVRLWGTDAENPTVTAHPEQVMGVAFSPDGRLASAGHDSVARVWEAANGRKPLTLKGHADIVTCVAFSPDGRRLASAGRDGTVRLWETGTGRELRAWKAHPDWVLGVAFRPDGRWLASAGRDQTVRLWEADTGRAVRILKGHTSEVWAVAFSLDGRWLASAGRDHTVRLWEADSGRPVRALTGHADVVTALACSPDGRRLASAGDRTVRLWEADTGRELLTLKGHASWVWAVAFSPDGRRLASAGADQTVRLWEADTGEELLTLSGHTGQVLGVAFSPDGQRLASASEDQTVRLWEAAPLPEEMLQPPHGKASRP
jgi:WD40 repeat protein/predicted Ser/Thr protein kinase